MNRVIYLQTPTIFSQLLNVRGVNDIRQTEIHTAEPLVPEPSVSEVELDTEKLKRHKLPGTDQILEEIIKEGGGTIRSEIHKLIHSIWNQEELPEEWKESIIFPIFKKGDKTGYRDYRGISLLPTTYKTLDFKLSPVLRVVCFLLGNSPASEFYISTFRNTLSVPSS